LLMYVMPLSGSDLGNAVRCFLDRSWKR
jgi:hypothetical protein